MNKSLFGLVVIGVMLALPVKADDEAKYQKSISKIANEINAISRNINANKKALKTEQDKLFEAEKSLKSLEKSIAKTNKSIEKQTQEFAQLDTKLESAKESQVLNQQALSNLIKSRYQNSDPNYIKRLLNQENPYAVGRLSNYHEYFSQALQSKIKQAQDELKQVAVLQKEHKQALALLEKEKSEQEKQRKSVEKNKEQRAKSIKKLSKKLESSSEKVEQLTKNRDRLNSLLKQIAKQKEKLKRLEEEQLRKQQSETGETKKVVIRPLVKGGFIKQKGRLAYPVEGKHLRQFGKRLAESGMVSEGLFIETKGVRQVKSIFRGRVIFAEFLKGYGLLLIIDHGDDHISLYGHNSTLYKKVGDVVETNDVIADTGVTGGLKKTGLYFEIRQNTTPVDPRKWCQ